MASTQATAVLRPQATAELKTVQATAVLKEQATAVLKNP